MTCCSLPPVRAVRTWQSPTGTRGGGDRKARVHAALTHERRTKLRGARQQWRGQDSNLRTQRGRIYSPVRLTASLPRQDGGECSDVASNDRPGSTSYAAYFGP